MKYENIFIISRMIAWEIDIAYRASMGLRMNDGERCQGRISRAFSGRQTPREVTQEFKNPYNHKHHRMVKTL